jgi:hypothetical protein
MTFGIIVIVFKPLLRGFFLIILMGELAMFLFGAPPKQDKEQLFQRDFLGTSYVLNSCIVPSRNGKIALQSKW